MSKIKLFIEDNMSKDKLIGNIILKELTEKVFSPERLIKICDDYNMEFDILIGNIILKELTQKVFCPERLIEYNFIF